MQLRSKEIGERLKDIENFLLEQYKENKEEKKRDWRTYEQRLAHKIKFAIRNLEPLIDEAVKTIQVRRGKGRKPRLVLKQKVILILLKELFSRSNRNMATMIDIFSLLSGIDISYKTVERLYSDPEIEMAVHNLHVLILKKKGVNDIDASGDGTGYSLTVRKHYASECEKRKEGVKRRGTGKRTFVYSFKLLDLKTRMYAAYGMSLKSEKKAFERAMKMLEEIDLQIGTVRLDRYYSSPSYVDRFGDAKVYIIPKKNTVLKRKSWKFKRLMKEFLTNTLLYLEQYYLRNNSEAEFSVDKRWFGWKLGQKREGRLDTALACINVWHNLFNLYKT